MSRKRKRVDDDYHSDDQYEEWIAQDDGGFKKRILLQVDIPQKALQCICTHVPQADLLAFALACRGFRRAQVAARPEQLLLHASHLKWGLPRRFQRQEVSMFFNLLSIKREEEAVAPEAAAATDAPADLAADASAPYKVVAAVRTPDGSERPLTEYEYSHVALLQPSFRLVEQPRRPGGIGGFRYPRAPRGQNYFTVRDLVDVVGRSRDAGKEFLRLAAARSQQHGEISLKLEWLDLAGSQAAGVVDYGEDDEDDDEEEPEYDEEDEDDDAYWAAAGASARDAASAAAAGAVAPGAAAASSAADELPPEAFDPQYEEDEDEDPLAAAKAAKRAFATAQP